MRTIADRCIEKGIKNSIDQRFIQGFIEGFTQGFIEGFAESITKVALKMLEQGFDLEVISSITGLSPDDLLKLKSKKGV